MSEQGKYKCVLQSIVEAFDEQVSSPGGEEGACCDMQNELTSGYLHP